METTKHPAHPAQWHMLYAARYVAKWEGLLTTAYLDTIAQPNVLTIGYGHTDAAGPPHVYSGMKITPEEALTILSHDLHGAAQAVERGIHGKMTFRQRMAFIDIAFNCGPGSVEGSTIARLFNEGKVAESANHFLDWDHAGGVVVQGLRNRRESERWMMIHPLHPVNPHKPSKSKDRKPIKGPAEPREATPPDQPELRIKTP